MHSICGCVYYRRDLVLYIPIEVPFGGPGKINTYISKLVGSSEYYGNQRLHWVAVELVLYNWCDSLTSKGPFLRQPVLCRILFIGGCVLILQFTQAPCLQGPASNLHGQVLQFNFVIATLKLIFL